MPLKTRIKAHPGFLHINGVTDADGHVDVATLVDLIYSEERIVYTNSGLGMAYNECKHTLFEWAYNASSTGQTSSEANNLQFDFAGFYFRNSRPAGRPYSSVMTDLVSEMTEDKALNHRAFRSMCKRIRMPKYLSIINFLYELKDIKRMVEFWSRRKKILKNISSGLLNEEFGWRPFLQDVCSVLTLLNEFHGRFKQWCANEHKVHVTHYKKILTEDDIIPRVLNFGYDGALSPVEFASLPQGTPIAPHGFVGNMSGTTSHLRAPEWIATMKYTYWCEEALGILKYVWNILDMVNIYWDPQVLWNMIPFSFLVDWFFNVGDWLHQQFSNPNLKVKMRVIDFCVSVKADCLNEGAVRVPLSASVYDFNDPSTYSYQNYQDRSRLYHRHPCPPVTEDPLRVLPPMDELRKLVLALALGHNCARPVRRHGRRQTGFRAQAG